ncbi:MAG: NrtA/SsuA/CpmA family ABC transporter substrate-binding protein [Desulfobacteraceae bacterium]|nr:NrtA/SsuA/CpmA family ABC transporter substrate-binding protein [Desulfobacteraceae bacterium]
MTNDHKVKQDLDIHTRLKRKFPVWIGALFAIMALLVGGLSFVSCKSNETGIREKVTVGVSKSYLSIPVYIAQTQGFFSDEGLDVTLKEYSSGKKATQALFAGEVGISTVADMPVVFESFKRQDFCIIATFTYSFLFVKIIARKDSGIKKGVDLKGKKVGANRGTSSHFFLGVFLIHNRLSISDVEMVNIRTVDLPAALRNSEVDAISVWQPYTQKAMQLLGDNAIELPNSEIYRTTFNFAVMKVFAKEHPEILQKFLRAIDKAAAFIRKDREKAQEIIAGSFNLDKNVVSAAWDDFVFGISLDQSLLLSWDNIARWAIKNKLVNKKKIPNYLNYICLDALQAVKPKSITIIR